MACLSDNRKMANPMGLFDLLTSLDKFTKGKLQRQVLMAGEDLLLAINALLDTGKMIQNLEIFSNISIMK